MSTLVHLGLGAFHRAHQVWYTHEADPDWNYVSFTGRSARMSDLLTAQDNKYTLVTRSKDGDTFDLIETITETQPAANVERLMELMASSDVKVVTLTITEAGYDDTSDNSAPQRIAKGLTARKASGAGPIAIMSCDNVSGNGEKCKQAVYAVADDELKAWMDENVTFPTTSIDRITPATTDELIELVKKETGFADKAPVVTEPFASWVIEGEFPAGRPNWEKAGVEFVEDIEPFEHRKLWLLNGSHSLMAYYGQLKGHETVADAICDPDVHEKVEALWDEAAQGLPMDVTDYRASLIERFENPNIRHNLAQIAIDGATKQQNRAVPIYGIAHGDGAAFSIAAWIVYCLTTEDIKDTRADEINEAKGESDPVQALCQVLGIDADEKIRAHVEEIQNA